MKVCIVGSGLSALTLAKALVNQKIFVDIISKNKRDKVNLSRTIGITKSNFDYFIKNIIDIKKISWKLKKIEIYTENFKDEKILKFENKNDQIFSIVKNFEIYEFLNKNLNKNKYIKKIKFIKKLSGFDKYDLIINTDYSSIFTKKFFNKKIVKKYDSSAYTTVINHKKILNDTATQIFTKLGPLAFLPISSYETSIIFSIHNSKKNLSKNLYKLIEQYNLKYKIKKIDKIESFDLKSFLLRSYYHNNILAFGDILHRIHPLAGQGFNMTIRDIKILIDIINERIVLGLPLDSSINSQFEKESRHKNYIFSNSIDLIHEFFNFERKFNNNILSKSVKFLGKNPSLNKMLNQLADKGINL
tara:strand:- start:242 stop:1318 length:1077 start_codon:yes stop_codon:yes gene_type:complete